MQIRNYGLLFRNSGGMPAGGHFVSRRPNGDLRDVPGQLRTAFVLLAPDGSACDPNPYEDNATLKQVGDGYMPLSQVDSWKAWALPWPLLKLDFASPPCNAQPSYGIAAASESRKCQVIATFSVASV